MPPQIVPPLNSIYVGQGEYGIAKPGQLVYTDKVCDCLTMVFMRHQQGNAALVIHADGYTKTEAIQRAIDQAFPPGTHLKVGLYGANGGGFSQENRQKIQEIKAANPNIVDDNEHRCIGQQWVLSQGGNGGVFINMDDAQNPIIQAIPNVDANRQEKKLSDAWLTVKLVRHNNFINQPEETLRCAADAEGHPANFTRAQAKEWVLYHEGIPGEALTPMLWEASPPFRASVLANAMNMKESTDTLSREEILKAGENKTYAEVERIISHINIGVKVEEDNKAIISMIKRASGVEEKDRNVAKLGIPFGYKTMADVKQQNTR